MTAAPADLEGVTRRLLVIAPLLVAVLAGGGAVAVVLMRSSTATRFATAPPPADPWRSGVVTLSSPGQGTALFDAGGRELTGGSTTARCLRVVYTGTADATVVLYGRTAGELAPYLDLTIDVGTGGSAGDCGGFAPDSTVYTGTMAGFGATSSAFDSGVGAWTAAAVGASRSYRITVAVRATAAAQGRTAEAGFVWEARAA